MSPCISIWTSPLTSNAEPLVAGFVAESLPGAPYASVSVVGCRPDEILERINDAFRRIVSMTMSDSTLHVVAVVPMFEDQAVSAILNLCNACTRTEHSVSLHLLGLCKGLSPVFESTVNSGAESSQNTALATLREACGLTTFSFSYSLVDNFAANGAPIRFSLESLSRYIALIQTALLIDYYSILSPALLSAHHGDNLSIGISSLLFDRADASRRLLGMGFLDGLDNVGINDSSVDAQKAATIAERFLLGIDRRFPDLFEHEIRPLYHDKGMEEGDVVARASDILDKDIESLKREILDLLGSDSLTLPEKEAVLAMILGRDNENLRGMQYQHEGTLLDDACSQPIELYVSAFNKDCVNRGLLPVRDDFEALRRQEYDSESQQWIPDPDDKNAMNPLPELKRLKQEILNTTSYMREKGDELRMLVRSEEQRRQAAEIKRKWNRPEGGMADVEYNEQPLSEKYEPTPGLQLKRTVDLRKFFSPVRNQDELGSCTSFATVAMYEAMMNMAGVEGENRMSPAYLYFYSNVMKGRPAGGSNYFEQLEVLGKNGVCYEKFYRYDAENPLRKPSVEANEDAASHRVISACQIPLISGSDLPAVMKENHRLLTSALSEGYPVGISLKVFSNFGEDGAFILHPEDAKDAKEDGWHAMVIAGYSEDGNFYIVRNSWGEAFGENGYCYIPTAYVDDPRYLNFACIIKEISDANGAHSVNIPTAIADFESSETEIRKAAIRNAISLARVELDYDRKLYNEYYRYYQQLMLRLTMPRVQNAVREEAEREKFMLLADIQITRRKLEDSFVGKHKSYKRNLQKIIAGMAAATLGLGAGWYFGGGTLVGILGGICLLITVLTWGGYKWWTRSHRRSLQEELDNIAKREATVKMEAQELQIRFHVSGMWLSRFYKLSSEIGDVYERLRSFNSTLRGWQKDYVREIEAPAKVSDQMFRTLDATPLLPAFFNANHDYIMKRINLMGLFGEYQVSEDDLEKYHAALRGTVTDAIDSLMDDFSIAEFLMGAEYPYLESIDIAQEISLLLSVGQPAFRNKEMNATSPVRMLMVNVKPERSAQWMAMMTPYFPLRPIEISIPDPTVLMILTIHPQRLAAPAAAD